MPKMKYWDDTAQQWIVLDANDATTLQGLSPSDFASATDVGVLEGDVTAHLADTVVHVTQTDKDTWNGKQDALGFTPEPAFAKNTAFNKNFGTTAGTVCQGDDSRLSDARTPTVHDNTKHSTAYATETALQSHLADNTNPHAVTKAQVGLGNVDNVKQATKTEFDAHLADNTKHVSKDGTLQSGLNAAMVGGENASTLKTNARALSTAKLIVEVKSSAPSSPTNGQIWYDSTNHKFKGYTNGAWV